MIRLSRKGWNNVLIFAVMAVILMFQLIERRSMSPLPESTSVMLLPADAVVLTWQGPGYRIERIGQSWRVVPSMGLNATQLATRLDFWLHQSWPIATQQDFPEQGDVIRVWLAGREQPLVLTLTQLQSHYYIRNWQGHWLELPADDYQQLLELSPKNA